MEWALTLAAGFFLAYFLVAGFGEHLGNWVARLFLITAVIFAIYWLLGYALSGLLLATGIADVMLAIRNAQPAAYDLARWAYYLFAIDVVLLGAPMIIALRVFLRRLQINLV